jgi:hypothetical protein
MASVYPTIEPHRPAAISLCAGKVLDPTSTVHSAKIRPSPVASTSVVPGPTWLSLRLDSGAPDESRNESGAIKEQWPRKDAIAGADGGTWRRRRPYSRS